MWNDPIYIKFVLGIGLTSVGWIEEMIPSLKVVSIIMGIVFMAISGWQVYQKGKMQKQQRKEIEERRDG